MDHVLKYWINAENIRFYDYYFFRRMNCFHTQYRLITRAECDESGRKKFYCQSHDLTVVAWHTYTHFIQCIMHCSHFWCLNEDCVHTYGMRNWIEFMKRFSFSITKVFFYNAFLNLLWISSQMQFSIKKMYGECSLKGILSRFLWRFLSNDDLLPLITLKYKKNQLFLPFFISLLSECAIKILKVIKSQKIHSPI